MFQRAMFDEIVLRMGNQAVEDIAWSETIGEPKDADDFALEVIFVICNSGMKNTIARQIYERITVALRAGLSASTAFGHKGKSAAIDDIWGRRAIYFRCYMRANDKLSHLGSLPWIGNITKYHLAKNFGLDVAKPDVHLQRLADLHETTAQELCADLARQTGYRIATVDTVLWRACANGVLDSRTGQLAIHPDGRKT